MRRLCLYTVLVAASITLVSGQARPGSLYGWLASYDGRPAHDVAKDPLFDGLLQVLVPDYAVGLGPDHTLSTALTTQVRNSFHAVHVSDHRFLTLEGYRVDNGASQSFLWVDLQNDRALGALYVRWGNRGDNSGDPAMLVFSRREAPVTDAASLPSEFLESLAAWQRAEHMPETMPQSFITERGQNVLLHTVEKCSGDEKAVARCAAANRLAAELDLAAALSARCRCSPPVPPQLPPQLQQEQDAWQIKSVEDCAFTRDADCVSRETHERAAALLTEAPTRVVPPTQIPSVGAPPTAPPATQKSDNGFKDDRAGVSFVAPAGWTSAVDGDNVVLHSADAKMTISVGSEVGVDFAAASANLVTDACRTFTGCTALGPAHPAILNTVPTLRATGSGISNGAAVQWRADLVQAKLPVLVLCFWNAGTMVEHAADLGSFTAGFSIEGVPGSGPITPPRLIYSPDPAYTDAARQNNIEGQLTAAVQIDSSGNVTDVKLQNRLGYGLDESAISAIRSWRFAPATQGGISLASVAMVVVNFKLGPG